MTQGLNMPSGSNSSMRGYSISVREEWRKRPRDIEIAKSALREACAMIQRLLQHLFEDATTLARANNRRRILEHDIRSVMRIYLPPKCVS